MRGAFAVIRQSLFALAQVSAFTLGVFARGETFSVHSEVPDNSSVGLTDPRTISGLSPRIVDLPVTLDIRGGFNGDLYAYRRLDNQSLVVLLNRAGADGQNSRVEPRAARRRGGALFPASSPQTLSIF